MKTVNQIFGIDSRVTVLNVQANGRFDGTRRAGMANDTKISALKILTQRRRNLLSCQVME
jgi:hypothetical protein